MPAWPEVLQEFAATPNEQRSGLLLQYLKRLYRHSRRNTILYATAWTLPRLNSVSPELMAITNDDMQGIMTVVRGMPKGALDLIIHSPGGSPAAAEMIVEYIRRKFDDFRVIVPGVSMSAATLMACGADRIVMGKHSFLGPTDPQLVLQTPLGRRLVPAQAILDQFDMGLEECKDRSRIPAWMPLFQQCAPDVLVQCQNALDLSDLLVRKWLRSYMLSKVTPALSKSVRFSRARKIAAWLNDHNEHKSHGRPLSRDQLTRVGLNIEPLEQDEEFQDLVLSIFHATTILFDQTSIVKLIMNHETGKTTMSVPNPVA